MNMPVEDLYEDQEHMEADESEGARTQTRGDDIVGTNELQPLDYADATREYEAASLNEEQREVRDGLAAERAFQDQARKDNVVTVDTNYSRQVRFRRYALAANAVLRICENKPNRGDLVITVVSGGPCSVGTSPGITPNGLDTAIVTGSRTIRTSERLYVTTDQVACIVDIQEEFS